MLVGRIGQFTRAPRARQPVAWAARGKWRSWNFDAFAQDSWKLRSNLTFEYGVRFGEWSNKNECPASAATSSRRLYDPTKGSFLNPGTYQQLNGVCYVFHRLRARRACIEDRGPFALPRVNVAWNIDGEGNNVLRGGYGYYYNRNMGNVEYDNTLRLPPNCLPGRRPTSGPAAATAAASA